MEWKWTPSDAIFANTRLRREPEALKLGAWASQVVTSQVVRAKQDLISLGSTSPSPNTMRIRGCQEIETFSRSTILVLHAGRRLIL